MQFIENDGGRADAGFKGNADDCSCRAIAITSGRPYQEIYDELNLWGAQERITKRRKKKGSARTGIRTPTLRRYLKSQDWTWVPTMHIGQGCKIHLRSEELPSGRLIVAVSRHLTAVINGTLHDTYDCSREGTRCVYGYWHKPV